ncbi:MAG TPA: hypothetical protein HPP83_04510 [Candidatus Hydrogenedentes bacterium]|nr:hypothetical protein [Candidatus Hydrogenedentota bacterium]
MTKRTSSATMVLGAALLACAANAYAWGPRTRESIASTALQVTRQEHLLAFRTAKENYEADLLAGAEAGRRALADYGVLKDENHIIVVITGELQLLREAREFGIDSYFSYRAGALGMLAAELMHPLGVELTLAELKLAERMDDDIEVRLRAGDYSYKPESEARQFIRDASVYFDQKRAFFQDNRRFIIQDYTTGEGYNGYLKNAGESYFARAVEVVADVWHSILKPGSEPTDAKPPASVLARYLASEIEYLLLEKNNMLEAEKTYYHLQQINPGVMEIPLKLGDLYAEYGDRARAVREWVYAQQTPGPVGREATVKLARLYIIIGEEFLEKGQEPGADEANLDDAMKAFQQALEYDSTNIEAADLYRSTRIEIQLREERRKYVMARIGEGQKLLNEATVRSTNRDYTSALANLKKAIEVFSLEDTREFADLATMAEEGVSTANRLIDKVENDVLDEAAEAITRGGAAVNDKRFEAAFDAFRSVESILEVIPSDPSTTRGKEKLQYIETANQKYGDAEREKKIWEQKQKQQQEALADRG